MSDTLTDKMKVALAETFAFYLKTHNYHWNVTGPSFYEYHLLFERIYTEVYDAVDDIAEHIRALGEYSPGGLARFGKLATIKDADVIPSGREMIKTLQEDNKAVVVALVAAYTAAEKEKQVGLANFLQDRIDKHQKHEWMLSASIKSV